MTSRLSNYHSSSSIVDCLLAIVVMVKHDGGIRGVQCSVVSDVAEASNFARILFITKRNSERDTVSDATKSIPSN